MNATNQTISEVSLVRLYLLRGLYLLVVVGLGIVQWPEVIREIIYQEKSWELMDGVVACMLTSSCLLIIIFPIIIPWRYVFANYFKKPGERWR
jgi:hypothetical protein